jgi:hypothetical protein
MPFCALPYITPTYVYVCVSCAKGIYERVYAKASKIKIIFFLLSLHERPFMLASLLFKEKHKRIQIARQNDSIVCVCVFVRSKNIKTNLPLLRRICCPWNKPVKVTVETGALFPLHARNINTRHNIFHKKKFIFLLRLFYLPRFCI